MVIQCESCQTEFKLDESLLKKEGTKVRCSRCRHVFTAYPTSSDVPDETGEIPNITEGAAAFPKKTDEMVPEEGWGKEAEKSAGEELDSDLDVIYRDVFSEDDGDPSGEEHKPGVETDDFFQKAGPGGRNRGGKPRLRFFPTWRPETKTLSRRKEGVPRKMGLHPKRNPQNVPWRYWSRCFLSSWGLPPHIMFGKPI